MKPHDDCNGHGGGSSSESEASGGEEGSFVSLCDAGWPARALAALNQLRKSRQHYDVLLVAGGAEVAAHRAVLAAASPLLLRELSAAPAQHRLDVPAAPLRALVEHAYTGRLSARSAAEARALYRCAAALRLDAARAQLADALLRRPAPAHALLLRDLPDLEPERLRALDDFIADNFDEICESGALAAVPEISVEMMRDSSSEGGCEAPQAIADAALAWLLDGGADVEELSSRAHLVYVDARGALRDCGELPAARGDAPELQQYRREAAARRPGPRAPPAPAAGRVLAARRSAGGGARALLVLRGRPVGARLRWTDVAAGGGGVARGAQLGGGAAATLAHARAAFGAAALDGRLLACGGYDRARVLRSAETYDPATNAWGAAADMLGPRARFAVARLGDELWALGGSDGQEELATVEAYGARGWQARPRLPGGVSHAGAAADEERLFVVGGWAGGATVKRVLVYEAAAGGWREGPALPAGRAQAAAAWWRGALWALGGCDAWRCVAEVARLAAGAARWEAGPALPTARRAAGACAWRGRLVAAGGSDGAASLRRTEWLAAEAEAWAPGPPLRRARAALGLAALGEALYAVGGHDGAEFLSCAEVLTAPDADWTLLHAAPRPHHPLPQLEQKQPEEEPPPQ